MLKLSLYSIKIEDFPSTTFRQRYIFLNSRKAIAGAIIGLLLVFVTIMYFVTKFFSSLSKLLLWPYDITTTSILSGFHNPFIVIYRSSLLIKQQKFFENL